jgi:hypothetical protein
MLKLKGDSFQHANRQQANPEERLALIVGIEPVQADYYGGVGFSAAVQIKHGAAQPESTRQKICRWLSTHLEQSKTAEQSRDKNPHGFLRYI